MTTHNIIARYWRRMVTGAMAFLLPVLAAAQTPGVNFGGVRFEPDPSSNGRMLVHMEVEIEGFLSAVDQQISAAMTHSCSRRPSRVGATRILAAGGLIWLSTPIRYEQWLCAVFKTRLFRYTFDAEWSIRVNSPARLNDLRLTAGLENAKGVPGEVEQWFNLQERLRTTINIPIPTDCGACSCAELMDDLDPIAERVSFGYRGGQNLQVGLVFSTSNEMTNLLRCVAR